VEQAAATLQKRLVLVREDPSAVATAAEARGRKRSRHRAPAALQAKEKSFSAEDRVLVADYASDDEARTPASCSASKSARSIVCGRGSSTGWDSGSDSDDDDDGDAAGLPQGRRGSGPTAGATTAAAAASAKAGASPEWSEDMKDTVASFVPKVFYCSRTHSQLAQFVREIRKTAFKDVRVVSLGSRRTMCIHPRVKQLQSDTAINDACLDLVQGKAEAPRAALQGRRKRDLGRASTGGTCPYLHPGEQEIFGQQILGKVMDIEDIVSRGQAQQCCPYYATRAVATVAELVVLPYTSLLHRGTRENLLGEKSLKGNVVIIDEAHNIIETINAVHTSAICERDIRTAHDALTHYLRKYRSRLSQDNVRYVGQVLQVLKALLRFLTRLKAPSAEGVARGHHTEALHASSRASARPAAGRVAGQRGTREMEDKSIYTINDFVFEAGIDNVNLIKLDRYLNVSELPRKLLGFLHLDEASGATQGLGSPGDSSEVPGGGGGQEHASGAAISSSVGSTASPPTPRSHVSPLSTIQRFLGSLTHADADGRVVLWRDADDDAWHAKFIVLNPAVHFQQVVDEAHAVVLVGGTMQPFEHVIQNLFPSVPQSRLHTFTCGHVIAPENIRPLAVARGPTNVRFDFRFQSRATPEQLDELGRLLVNVCTVTPAGVVCFLPSYDYERKAVDHWTLQGTLRRLKERKRVFREPRSSADVDAVLASYSQAIANCENPRPGSAVTGALLFCVVGAKMSEGINFSDDLARCVVMVGLPYPDRSDPELQQKMAFLDSRPRGASGAAASPAQSAGSEYYENLCMRAVNQSIGRAIRHINDYAAILLVDHRYASRDAVARKLPGWIAGELRNAASFGAVVAGLSEFFRDKA